MTPRNEEIARRVAAGERQADVARAVGLTPARVSQIVKSACGDPLPPGSRVVRLRVKPDAQMALSSLPVLIRAMASEHEDARAKEAAALALEERVREAVARVMAEFEPERSACRAEALEASRRSEESVLAVAVALEAISRGGSEEMAAAAAVAFEDAGLPVPAGRLGLRCDSEVGR